MKRGKTVGSRANKRLAAKECNSSRYPQSWWPSIAKQYVYLAVIQPLGVAKIGVSNGPEARTYGLYREGHRPKVVSEIQCCCRLHARELERDFHLLLRPHCESGEWFLMTPKEVAALARAFDRLAANPPARPPYDLFSALVGL